MNPSWPTLTLGNVLTLSTIGATILTWVLTIRKEEAQTWVDNFINSLIVVPPFYYFTAFILLLYSFPPINQSQEVAEICAYAGHFSALFGTFLVGILGLYFMTRALWDTFDRYLYRKYLRRFEEDIRQR